MTKKIISAVMAAAMLMSVSLTSFADGATIIKPATKTETTAKEQTDTEKKAIIKKSSEADAEEKTETTSDTKKVIKSSSLSSQLKSVKLSYASFKCPKNVTTEKFDAKAYDVSLGEFGSGDSILVRVRAFDHDTSLNEEVVDENGLMYGMYNGFLTVSSAKKSSAEAAKGLGSQTIRKEVVSLFNKALKADNNGKAASYTANKNMGGIQIIYSDDGTTENCTILHGKDYDYVLYGVSSDKDKATLNELVSVIAKDLTEKPKAA